MTWPREATGGESPGAQSRAGGKGWRGNLKGQTEYLVKATGARGRGAGKWDELWVRPAT